ncbi:MAG: Mut7-C RNAse domain-containing protein [Anaerolineales bacterium]
MIHVTLHGSLNDFLPAKRRGQPQVFMCPQGEQPALKHILASLGVPPVEVGRALLNDIPTPLSSKTPDHSRVAAYPHTASPWPAENGAPCFVLDNHLGKLASYLRILGFDTLYRNDYQDDELARRATEGRILLTRDRQLLMRNAVRYGHWLRSKTPRQQFQAVAACFNLKEHIALFSRCPHCNTVLMPVEKSAVLERLEPLTRRYYDDFRCCPTCDRIYWQGSHHERMQGWLTEVFTTTDPYGPA